MSATVPDDLSQARQQLEELDQLLQKMLESPDPASGLSAGLPDDATLPAFELPDMPVVPPVRLVREPAVNLIETPLPDTKTISPARQFEAEEEDDYVSVLDRPPRSPALLLPLVGVDCAYAVCTKPFGPLGRWMYGSAGKALLGLAGVLLLLGAIGLAVMDWLGWTW